MKLLQSEVRTQLKAKLNYDEEMTEDNDNSDVLKGWIYEGTKEWSDFHSFSFHNDGIEILFPTYQVSSYADGSHAVKVAYQKIIKTLRSEFISYLNLENLNY